MATYVALIRGIGPGNPNMTGAKFKATFEKIGFKNVAPVINSGNVVFDSPSKDEAALESKIEKALTMHLGFTRMTIVRSQQDLEALVRKNPFKGVEDKMPNYLLVTFFKDRRKEVATVLKINERGATQFMSDIDKTHKKQITSRTWKTVGRILKKMESR